MLGTWQRPPTHLLRDFAPSLMALRPQKEAALFREHCLGPCGWPKAAKSCGRPELPSRDRPLCPAGMGWDEDGEVETGRSVCSSQACSWPWDLRPAQSSLSTESYLLMNLSSQSGDSMEAPQCPGPGFLLSYCSTSLASDLLLVGQGSCLSSCHHICLPVNEEEDVRKGSPSPFKDTSPEIPYTTSAHTPLART